MVDAVRGDDCADECPLGGMVSDFSVAYQHDPGVKQKGGAGCPLGRMLSAVPDLRSTHAEDAAVQAMGGGGA